MSIIKMPNFAYYNTLFRFKNLSMQDRDIILYNYKNKTRIQHVSNKYIKNKFNSTPYKNELVANYKKHHAIHMKLRTDKYYVQNLCLQGSLLSSTIYISFENGLMYNLYIAIVISVIYLTIDGIHYNKLLSNTDFICSSYIITLYYILLVNLI